MTLSRSQFGSMAGRCLALIALASLAPAAVAQRSAANQNAAAAAAQDAATRYAQTVAEATVTERYNASLQRLLQSQQSELAALQMQIDGLDATAAEVQPMLEQMFTDLEQFVGSDVPFLQMERSARIARLRELMSNPEAPAAEKYRRLLEAYTIEMEYGRTMDYYRQMLADGREADFVRLGRVSLMYRTTDGRETAYWDKDQKMWVVDPAYSRAVDDALRIAKQEVAPDLITVPVPAAAPGGRS